MIPHCCAKWKLWKKFWTEKRALPTIGSAPKDQTFIRVKQKFLHELFTKSSRILKAEPLVALRRVRHSLSVKAHFWKFENFLQVKKFSKTNYKHRLTSKIIQWMIFDGWDLHLNSWYFLFWVIFCKNLFVHDWYSTNSRKISHWEVFLESACRFSVKGAFLLQKSPLLQSKSWIVKFTRKGAWR